MEAAGRGIAQSQLVGTVGTWYQHGWHSIRVHRSVPLVLEDLEIDPADDSRRRSLGSSIVAQRKHSGYPGSGSNIGLNVHSKKECASIVTVPPAVAIICYT